MRRSGGVRRERTDHTKRFRRTLAGFGLTWHQKVHFSTFSGKLTFQCTRNSAQNPPFCPGSLQDTVFYLFLDISPTYSPNIFCKKKNIENRKSENLKIQKPRFTNRSPGRGSFLFDDVSCCESIWKRIVYTPWFFWQYSLNGLSILLHRKSRI